MSSIANNVFNSSYSDVQAALSSGSLTARFKSLNVTGIESNKDVMTDSSGNFIGSEPADLSNYVSKTELTTQTLSGDLNLPSGIGNVNVGAELGTVITQTSGNTANITTLQNKTQHQSENGGYTDFNSFIRYQGFPYENPTALNHVTSKAYVDNQVNTKAGRTVSTDNPTSGDDVNDGYSIGDIWVNEEGTQSFICVNNSVDAAEWELFGNDQSLNTNDNVSFNSVNTPAISSGTDVTVSSPLIVDNTIKLNNNIFDANGNQAYIMSRPSSDVFKLGANVNVNVASLGIGQNIGNNTRAGPDCVLIGINVGQSPYNYAESVVIGSNCGNNLSNTNGGSVVIGHIANKFGIANGSVYIGQRSGFNSDGVRNICIGRYSGTNITSGKNCTFLGTDSSSTAGTLDEQIAIGWNAQTTAANQCVVGSTDLAQFQSNGFRDLDTKSANVLGIGKTNATKVEIAKTGVTTEVKGDLMASGGVEIRDYTTSAPTDALSGKLYKAASDERIHWLTNTNDSVLAYKTEVDSKAGRTVSTDNPTANDDVDQGYSIGDIWVNEEGTQSFICVNNSVDAAEWELFGNDQSLNTNDSVSFTSVNTPAISSGTDVTVSSPLIVDNTIKLNNNIFDANGNQAYIMSRPSSDVFKLGANVNVNVASLGIGQNIGNNTRAGPDCVLIGINVGQSPYNYAESVVIGSNCGNNLSNTNGGSVVIGHIANKFGIANGSVYIGQRSGFNSDGVRNICIGRYSGTNITSGKNCTFLGTDSSSTAGTLDEQIAIGWNAQTTAANQCVVGSTDLAQFQSNGFRDLDTKSANVLGIGKTNATKVEIAKTGVTTEVKGDLMASGGVEIRDYTTSAPTDALSGKLYKATGDDRIHWLTNTKDTILADDADVSAMREVAYSTGIKSGGLLTINSANDTLFDISDGSGVVYDSLTNNVSNVSWTGLSGLSPTVPYTGILTYVFIDNTGTPFTSASPPTNSQQRDNIYIGVLVHVNQTNLNTTNDQQAYLAYPINQMRDIADAIGFLNISGNLLSSTTGLTISKSDGKMLSFGANYKNDPKDPNILSLPAIDTSAGGIFQYRAYNGTSSVLTLTTIIPNYLDDGSAWGTSTATIAAQKWSAQRVYSFTSNALKIQAGQFSYNSAAEAIGGIQNEDFITEASIADNGLLIGYLIVRGGATDLTLSSDAQFLSAGKFGSSFSTVSGSVSTLQNVYDNSGVEPEILTDATRGAVTIQCGSALDADNILEGKNIAGTTTFGVTGSGNLTVGGQIQSSSSTMVLSPLPPGDGSFGVVESYGILKVIDDDGFKNTLTIQAADGLGQHSDTGPLINEFKFTSLMLKDRLGTLYPWLTLENETSGPTLQGRTSIYCKNDLVMRLSSTNGVQAFYRVRCSDTTPSTTTTTGSITTAGGLGVVGDVKVGAGIELFADNAVKPTSTTWTIASDIQFKEDIQDADLQRCADDISTLQLMRFKWKDDYITKYNVKDHHTLGFIAQDVQTKFPKSVDTIVEKDEVNNTESSRLGLDYHAINMSLIGAVQYLIKENQLLKSRLDILESK